jgi:hypothetical protein
MTIDYRFTQDGAKLTATVDGPRETTAGRLLRERDLDRRR